MEINGILDKIVSDKSGVSKSTGQPWRICEFLMEVPGHYPRHVCFRVRDGQVGRIARFESFIGKMVTVSFDINANENEGRWYNEINAYGVTPYLTQDARQENILIAQGN